jgi:hypothetical protein
MNSQKEASQARLSFDSCRDVLWTMNNLRSRREKTSSRKKIEVVTQDDFGHKLVRSVYT